MINVELDICKRIDFDLNSFRSGDSKWVFRKICLSKRLRSENGSFYFIKKAYLECLFSILFSQTRFYSIRVFKETKEFFSSGLFSFKLQRIFCFLVILTLSCLTRMLSIKYAQSILCSGQPSMSLNCQKVFSVNLYTVFPLFLIFSWNKKKIIFCVQMQIYRLFKRCFMNTKFIVTKQSFRCQLNRFSPLDNNNFFCLICLVSLFVFSIFILHVFCRWNFFALPIYSFTKWIVDAEFFVFFSFHFLRRGWGCTTNSVWCA